MGTNDTDTPTCGWDTRLSADGTFIAEHGDVNVTAHQMAECCFVFVTVGPAALRIDCRTGEVITKPRGALWIDHHDVVLQETWGRLP